VNNRFISIDAFRAVTMLLMIFVNDFWTLHDIPGWLGHADANEDRLGFSDIIFPAFLFIVGLSVPIAIDNRLKKNDSAWSVQQHILWRAFALLVMGFFHYNLENYSEQALLPKGVWEILLTAAFFLIWLDYSEWKGKTAIVLKSAGILLLVALSLVYKGRYNDGPWMQPGWWGILGLIGWTYLVVSSVYLWSRGVLRIQYIALVVFLFLNCAEAVGLLDFLLPAKEYVWLVSDGSMPAMAMAGIITVIYYRRNGVSGRTFWIFVVISSILLITFGLGTRGMWGISKIRATPSWTAICTGISIATFALIVFITDIKGMVRWYRVIKPAGVVTLTCYLLPYIHGGFFQLADIRLPLFLRTGSIGLMKSFVFAWLIIAIAGWLKKKGIALKV
jgi:predicted acyltransferase